MNLQCTDTNSSNLPHARWPRLAFRSLARMALSRACKGRAPTPSTAAPGKTQFSVLHTYISDMCLDRHIIVFAEEQPHSAAGALQLTGKRPNARLRTKHTQVAATGRHTARHFLPGLLSMQSLLQRWNLFSRKPDEEIQDGPCPKLRHSHPPSMHSLGHGSGLAGLPQASLTAGQGDGRGRASGE